MKKWLKLLFGTLFIGVVCSFAYLRDSTNACAYAEADEVFEEKTYTYVEEGKGEATIILTSETECVMTLVEEGKEPVSYNCTYTLDGDVLTFNYATFSETVVLNNENMTFGEYVEPSQEEDWFKAKWETYIVPLFGGVSLTAIVSFVATLLMNHFKTKRLDKKVEDMENGWLKKEERYNNLLVEADNKLLAIGQIATTMTNVYNLVLESNKVDTETKTYLQEKCDVLVTKINLVTDSTNKIDGLKRAIALQTQLFIKVAKTMPEAVKSGIINDLNKIAELVATL